MSRIIVHKRALKYIRKLSGPQKNRLKDALKKLETDHLDNPNVKQMFGEWFGYFRMRIGNIRVIFYYDDTEDVIYVDHIGPRGDIYK